MFVTVCSCLAEYVLPVDITASRLEAKVSARILIWFWEAKLMLPSEVAVVPMKFILLPEVMLKSLPDESLPSDVIAC